MRVDHPRPVVPLPRSLVIFIVFPYINASTALISLVFHCFALVFLAFALVFLGFRWVSLVFIVFPWFSLRFIDFL